MKKVMAVFLSMMLLISLTACGQSETGRQENTQADIPSEGRTPDTDAADISGAAGQETVVEDGFVRVTGGTFRMGSPETESWRSDDETQHTVTVSDYPYHYQCLRQAGFAIKNCMVVEKGTVGGIGDLKGSFANNAEWIIFCQKGRRIFNHTTLLQNRKKEGTKFHAGREPSKKYKTRFNACWFGSEYPKATYNSVWQKQNGIYHPTIKNVEFLSWLIQISSQPGELIFDGFMGTGSTALAAIETDRRYLGAEINRGYYETAVRRIAKMQ